MALSRSTKPKMLVKVCPDTAALRMTIGKCGCRVDMENTYPGRLKMQVRRKGADAWQIEYPCFDVDNGRAEFRFDRLLWGLCAGRYDARLLMDGCECGRFALEMVQRGCDVSAAGAETVLSKEHHFAIEYPPGVTDMFDTIVTFSGFLTAPMDHSDQVLPLCEDAKQQLCALSLCKPVQLMVYDNVRSELVEFSGCVGSNHNVVVQRGMGDTTPQRFPRGAKVKFVWSTDNVLRAKEGC